MRTATAIAVLGLTTAAHAAGGSTVNVTYPASLAAGPLDGRLLLLLSTDDQEEPRFGISDTELGTQQVFGIDVDGWKPGAVATFAPTVVGYPVATLSAVPAGTYHLQVVLHRYETFRRADGHTVKLPMDRGEGQQWNRAPGNLYSTPQKVPLGLAGGKGPITIALDKAMPAIEPPADTKYVKHDRIRSERLSKFWGRDMYLGAHVLLPEGWDTHPQARYPLVINHGHFPANFGGFRPEPPDPDLKCERSERFGLDCYNKTVQEHAHQFYKEWTGPNFPRVLIVEIQHANPYYDDSYAVNSANVGPYGDAITYELIPYLEQKYRGLGAGWARFMYGGSTGGWEAMAAQVFYPDEYNGAWIACPDPIDFRANTVIDIYKDENAYYAKGPWRTVERPAHRNFLGHVSSTIEQANRLEAVLGDKTRSGGQWDIWEAVYSPVGEDGYPQRLWDKKTGAIDKAVAEQWKSYDLVHVLRRDWEKGLGEKLRGKLFLYVGDMDNYYLNNAVYLAEEFLKGTTNPPYEGVVDYGDRAEHCWNGDHTRPNALSRLRYHQMFVPKIVERIAKSAPAGADVTSWKY
jgi:hypothetical protein